MARTLKRLQVAMQISLRPVLNLDLSLRLGGGSIGSVLTETESFLREDSDHMHALVFFARGKKASRYRSWMDFLLCETFSHFRKPCFKFYRDRGPALRDMPEISIRAYDALLLRFMRHAYTLYTEERRHSWIELWRDADDRGLVTPP